MNGELQFLYFAVKDARGHIEFAEERAKSMGLPGTASELSLAASRLESVLFEIERGVEPEFGKYRVKREQTE